MRFLEYLGAMLSTLRLIPHLAIFQYLDHSGFMHADVARWGLFLPNIGTLRKPSRRFLRLMSEYPEYRNLFYARAGHIGKWFKPLCPPLLTLFIHTHDIGPGLFIQHGFATIISARKIGKNCWINQQVTIGYSNSSDCPTLGDNVMVTAGAKIIGNVSVGDNTKIGANAVVVKDVPPNVTVVGIPAYIVRRDGKRVTEPL